MSPRSALIGRSGELVFISPADRGAVSLSAPFTAGAPVLSPNASAPMARLLRVVPSGHVLVVVPLPRALTGCGSVGPTGHRCIPNFITPVLYYV